MLTLLCNKSKTTIGIIGCRELESNLATLQAESWKVNLQHCRQRAGKLSCNTAGRELGSYIATLQAESWKGILQHGAAMHVESLIVFVNVKHIKSSLDCYSTNLFQSRHLINYRFDLPFTVKLKQMFHCFMK